MQLRQYRKARNLTLQDIAELVGWSFNKVSRHERGLVNPRTDEIEKYRKATGGEVTADDWMALTREVGRKSRAAAATPDKENAVA